MKKEKDFADFIREDQSAASTQSSPPSALLATIREDLNPNALRVFTKLVGIHFFASLITLSICPQFGFRVFGEGMGLMHFFMSLGPVGCIVACGAFFTGTSVFLAGLLLRGEEVRKIREHRLLGLGALGLLSLGVFIMLDAEIALTLSIAWLIGTAVGSIGTLELAWRLRFPLHKVN